jgi:sucrose-6-phosphate hydrolase SacC (GH32 family)
MRFYSSSNLKDWEYQSGFGKGYGVQPNQFECPDFIQLPVDGDKNNMKWVMIVNTLMMKRMRRSKLCTTSANTAVCTTSSSETSKSLKVRINNKLRKSLLK